MTIPMKATYTIQDRKGKKSKVIAYIKYDYPNIPSTLDLPNAIVIAQHIATLLDGLINGVIININLSLNVSLPSGIKFNPLSSSDVEEKAVFVFQGHELGGRHEMSVPAIKNDIFIDGTEDVDRNHPAVVDFSFDMTDGSSSPLDYYDTADNRDEAMTLFRGGFKKFRKS